MKTLVSKLQYKNFETGEFTGIQERSLTETIELINNFPWREQREHLNISLTNPSVTIEGNNHDYLKFALYYNQKFVLYYLSQSQKLHTKSFSSIGDATPYITKLFELAEFDTTGFKAENTWLQQNLPHFATADFRYEVTMSKSRRYLLSTSGMNIILTPAILILIFSKSVDDSNPLVILLLLSIAFFFGGGLHLIFFFQYYQYAKDKALVMSKGNDHFYYGHIDKPILYNKKDIEQVSIIRSEGTRNPFNGFAVVEIAFKNAATIKIPNLLISYTALREKLFEYPIVNVNRLAGLSQ